MLEKLAIVADYADNHGQHSFANDATKLIKNAQLFDALRTLFDPGYSGLDRDSGYWKRLQRGWSRGKMDRGLGLLLAINAERTKLNKKIDELAAPIKIFQEQVGAFYEKLRAGSSDVRADSLKNELRELQNGLKDMLKLVASKELKNALKLREKLQEQQLKALDKIKGLDEETKNYLGAVLRGEQPSGRSESSSGSSNDADKLSNMRSWLKNLNIPKKSMRTGAKSYAGLFAFKNFMKDFIYNPTAIIEFFDANPTLEQEGFERYGDVFGEMLAQAHQKISWDERKSKDEGKKEIAKEVPGAHEPVEPVAEIAPPISSAPHIKPKEETIIPAPGLTVEEEKIRREISPHMAKKRQEQRDRELAQLKALQELQTAEKAKEKSKRKKKETAAPVPAPATTEVATPSVASKMIGRQITRFGRFKKLKTIARDLRFIEEEHSPEPEMNMEELLDLKRRVDKLPLDDPQYQSMPSFEEKDLTSNIRQVLDEKQHGSTPVYDTRHDEFDMLYGKLKDLRGLFVRKYPDEMPEDELEKLPEIKLMTRIYKKLYQVLTEDMGYSDRMAEKRLQAKNNSYALLKHAEVMREDGSRVSAIECVICGQIINKNHWLCNNCSQDAAEYGLTKKEYACLPDGELEDIAARGWAFNPEPLSEQPDVLDQTGPEWEDDTTPEEEKRSFNSIRMEQLKKIAVSLEEAIKLLNLDKSKRPLVGDPMYGEHDKDDPGPDIFEAFPEGRERFDEEKHFNPEEVEYYKGRKSDEDYFDEVDMRTDKRNMYLSPEDDDWEPTMRRSEPVLKLTPQEELEEIVLHLRDIDRRMENLIRRSTPDNEIADRIGLHRLKEEKALSLKRKKFIEDKYNIPAF